MLWRASLRRAVRSGYRPSNRHWIPWSWHAGRRSDALALIVLPIVVTDARLFECFIDDAGEMQLREATHLTIGWQHPGAERPLMFVEILRADEVGAYATAVREALGVLSSKEKAAAGATAACQKKQMTDAADGAS